MHDHLPILAVSPFPSSKVPTAPLKADNPSDPGDKMFTQVFLNQLQPEYAMLVNPDEMSKISLLLLAAEGKQCFQEQLSDGLCRSSPWSNLELRSRDQKEEQRREVHPLSEPALCCFPPCWGQSFTLLSSL